MTTPAKPRKPGSQVAPGQRPLFTNGKTATTHSKVPIAQATAGKLYRVRDKDWVAVWGESLSWEAATKLKDQVVASGKTRTARVEDMAIPPPAEYLDRLAQEAAGEEAAEDAAEEMSWSHGHSQGEADEMMERQAVHQHQGDARDVLGDRAQNWSPTVVDPSTAEIASTGGRTISGVLDPQLARAQAQAVAAVRPIAAASQARSTQKTRAPYRDKTVTPPGRSTQPPPRDRTVSRAPTAVEPPPSPLQVANELDGDLLPDDVLTDADIPDLASDVGGGPSEDDIALAQRQRDADERSRAQQRR